MFLSYFFIDSFLVKYCISNNNRVFHKFVPIVNCILRKKFNASLGKCKLIQVGNLSK